MREPCPCREFRQANIFYRQLRQSKVILPTTQTGKGILAFTSAKIGVAMRSTNLTLREFLTATEGIDSDSRMRAAERELAEVEKLPYWRQKGATPANDRKIEQYKADLKAWLQDNYYR